MIHSGIFLSYLSFLMHKPDATANITGSKKYPDIKGVVNFFQTKSGVIVSAEMEGLPFTNDVCNKPIFGFHIHSGNMCSGNSEDPFADAMSHYNPKNCTHPFHAGDLPPLFGNDGYAFMMVLSDRFTVKEIIGKTVIIHSEPDDFTSQPSGNAGEKMACGVIR